MTLLKIPYNDARDFLRVRDFLVRTYRRDHRAYNWMIDRWEFCRSFAQTMHGTTLSWPQTVGLWTEDGEIRAVATSEGENGGEAHFLLDFAEGPVPPPLVSALFDHVEANLAVRSPGGPALKVRISERRPELAAEARRRGFRPVWTETMSHKPIDPEEAAVLPTGYRLAWGEQVSDQAKGRAHVRAFGYEMDPRAPRAATCWTALRRMPDWRAELELFVVGPDENVVSFVTLWLDETNRLAICEPVGTDPDHRQRGLARTLITEGGRRAAVLGAGELMVGTDQPFYRACGFTPLERHEVWER